jgi:hypothetical protein
VESSSLGKQRANRRSHRNGAVCRFLAALGASVILGFGVGAPIAAAQAPAAVPLHDGGGDVGAGDQRGEQLRVALERLFQQLLAELRERDHGVQAGSPPPPPPPPPLPPPTPTTVPVPVPATTPPVTVPKLTGPPPAGPSGGTVAARTVPSNAASANLVAASTGNGGAPGAAPPQRAPSPPLAAPATAPRNPVARALRTARSYGALLALAAAVVIFLLIQGRLDRRDPRILSAPAEYGLSFRDFE